MRAERRLGSGDVLAGFAGATADAFTLFELFEDKLARHNGIPRARGGGAGQGWRTDRRLGRLEAMLAVADRESSLLISGNGDVLEPENGLIAIGRADLSPGRRACAQREHRAPGQDIVERALKIAGDICTTPTTTSRSKRW